MSSTTLQDSKHKVAIIESLYRYAAGIDLKDADLIRSVFTEDAVSDFRPAAAKAGFEYPVLQGRETIVSALMGSLGPIVTTHSVSNPRVFLNGDSAQMDVLVEAQHVPASDPSRHYMMKNRYQVELLQQGQEWLIHHVTVDNVWRTGDPTVLAGV